MEHKISEQTGMPGRRFHATKRNFLKIVESTEENLKSIEENYLSEMYVGKI